MKQKLKTTSQIAIGIFTLTVGTAIMVGFVAIPSSQNIVTLGQQISDAQARVSKTIARGLQFRDIAQNTDMIKKNLPRLSRMMIIPGKEVDFFTTLEQKNQLRNLDQIIRLGDPKPITPSIRELPLTFELRGEYAGIMAYINDLERAPEQILIRKVVIHPASETDKTQKPLIATVEGSIYVGTP